MGRPAHAAHVADAVLRRGCGTLPSGGCVLKVELNLLVDGSRGCGAGKKNVRLDLEYVYFIVKVLTVKK